MLIIVCGLPGSGKSSVARMLVEKIGAVYLGSDAIRKRMFQKPEYTEEEKSKVYGKMIELMKEAIHKGKHVIADATFYSSGYRQRFISEANALGEEHRIIVCSLPEDEAKRRLAKRKESGAALSDADYEVYLKLKESFEPILEEHLELDCSLPAPSRLKNALVFLGL